MTYTPSKKILERYADVLVNFALGGGRGVKKGETVFLTISEDAKPLLAPLREAIWKSGGNIILNYHPSEDERYLSAADFYRFADKDQLSFFPRKYFKGLVDDIDHQLTILSTSDPKARAGVRPEKLMAHRKSYRPFMDWRDEKENSGKFSWTLALYGTPAMAKEAGLTLVEYWGQIINACFLDKKNPIAEWKKVFKQIDATLKKLNSLPIKRLHVEGPEINLWIKLGEKRKWLGGRGANIPSFEIFTSPDWRGTEGFVRFDQPLYFSGNLIKGIELEFKKGEIITAKAKENEKFLKEMIRTDVGAKRVGEFSLTDKRLSRITKFMAETLYDENVGGENGNTHIAIGKSYQDAFAGNPDKKSKGFWKKLGFNDSAIHNDIVSTTPRTVTAYLTNGKEKVIYTDGMFTM